MNRQYNMVWLVAEESRLVLEQVRCDRSLGWGAGPRFSPFKGRGGACLFSQCYSTKEDKEERKEAKDGAKIRR